MLTDNYFSTYDVDKIYIFNGLSNDTITVHKSDIETITITDKEIGLICYGDDKDFLWWESTGNRDGVMTSNNVYTDVFYMFFNTDKKIDELLEIDITYKAFDYRIYKNNETKMMQTAITESKYNDLVNNKPIAFNGDNFYLNKLSQTTKTILPGNQTIAYDSSSWWGKHTLKYVNLNKILDLEKLNLEDEDRFIFSDYAKDYKWAVKFFESTKTLETIGVLDYVKGSGVSNVAALRLKFQTGGIVYNCYAIDTATDDFSGNKVFEESTEDSSDLFQKLMMLMGLLIIICFLPTVIPILNTALSFLFKTLLSVCKFIISLIITPFKLLFNKKKNK